MGVRKLCNVPTAAGRAGALEWAYANSARLWYARRAAASLGGMRPTCSHARSLAATCRVRSCLRLSECEALQMDGAVPLPLPPSSPPSSMSYQQGEADVDVSPSVGDNEFDSLARRPQQPDLRAVEVRAASTVLQLFDRERHWGVAGCALPHVGVWSLLEAQAVVALVLEDDGDSVPDLADRPRAVLNEFPALLDVGATAAPDAICLGRRMKRPAALAAADLAAVAAAFVAAVAATLAAAALGAAGLDPDAFAPAALAFAALAAAALAPAGLGLAALAPAALASVAFAYAVLFLAAIAPVALVFAARAPAALAPAALAFAALAAAALAPAALAPLLTRKPKNPVVGSPSVSVVSPHCSQESPMNSTHTSHTARSEATHCVPLYCDLDAAHLESRVRAGCRVVASSGLAIADFLVIMLGGFTAKRCRTCGLLKFGRQGPGEDVCRCCACVSTTCSHTPGNCLQRIKTHGAHRCPSCLKVYGIKRRERLRGNQSAILNIDGQLHPMLMNTNDVDEHRDTATCVADLIPSGAMLAWVVLFHDWIWLWDSHALSWRLLKLQPC